MADDEYYDEDEYGEGPPPPHDPHEQRYYADEQLPPPHYDDDALPPTAGNYANYESTPYEMNSDDEGNQNAGGRRGGDEMAYDFPGEPSPMGGHGGGGAPPYHMQDGPTSPLGRSYGSQHAQSTSSLPEEIDVNTHALIDETIQRLSFVHGVLGVLIVDRDGLIVRATMPMEEAAQLSGPTLSLLSRARDTVKKAEADGDDELRMLCVRTRKHELLLCSEADGAFAVCVVQDPTPASADEANVVGAAKSQAAKAVLRGGSVLGQPSTGVTL